MPKRSCTWGSVPAAGCALLLVAAVASAQIPGKDAVEQFYRGRTINIYVGLAVGGGYDGYARLLARHFGKYIPGNPTIVPQNMPGAGSNKAAGFVYGQAPKDGTAIGAIQPGAVLAPLLTDQPVQHDSRKFIYLGSANGDIYLCFVRADAPVKSFAETFSREVILGPAPRAPRCATCRSCSTTCSAPNFAW
jgi:tripartite-type tricarboxylate transporter receptor subunit TctC